MTLDGIGKMKTKIFADGADKEAILALYKKPYIKGFTTNPTLMHKPDFELVVARMVAGERLERETFRKAAPGAVKPKPAVNTKPTPVVTHTLNATPKVNGARKSAEAVEQKFQTSGRVEDLTNLLAQRRTDRLKAANAA